jgi:DNA-binding MarR family transcriptional regulator
MSDQPPHPNFPIPALMHFARGSYGDAARHALAAAGYDDLPRNGGMVLAGLDSPEPGFVRQADAVATLRRSKQRSSQLVDTLVLRGYVERTIDPDDRRRMSVRLTDRGRGAAAAIQEAVDAVDAELERRITAEQMRGLRAGLAALGEIRTRRAGDAD